MDCERLLKYCFRGPLLFPAGKRRRRQSDEGDIGVEELPTARSTTLVRLGYKGDGTEFGQNCQPVRHGSKRVRRSVRRGTQKKPKDQEIPRRFSTNRWQTSWTRYCTWPLLAVPHRSCVSIDRVLRSYSESDGE